MPAKGHKARIDGHGRNRKEPYSAPPTLNNGAPGQFTGMRPVELSDEQLPSINHVEWLNDFARITLLPSPAPMTPRRLGTATRLQWAARYIQMLEMTVKNQLVEIERLVNQATADEVERNERKIIP